MKPNDIDKTTISYKINASGIDELIKLIGQMDYHLKAANTLKDKIDAVYIDVDFDRVTNKTTTNDTEHTDM